MHSLKLKPELIKLSKNERLYNLSIPIIGLTGGIACGKSSVANLFRALGILVIDADKIVHQIYQKSDSVAYIQKIAPDCVINELIDFKLLRSKFFNNPQIKEDIQNFIYSKMPSVIKEELVTQNELPFIVYDVPLLFEKNLENKIDYSIVVYSPRHIQLERLLKRDKIQPELANSILDQQMDIERKKQLAHYVLDNSSDLDHLRTEFQTLTSSIFNT